MFTWYEGFLACILLLWAFASPRDRNALRIVLIATLASEVIVEGVTRQIHGHWKLVIPSLVETLTILCLLRWSPNRTGHLNVGCLCAAWLAHLMCYMDLWLGTRFWYDNYEAIIFAVALAQLASFHDTIGHAFGRLSDFFRRLGMDRASAVSAPSHASGVLPDKGSQSL